MASFLFQYTFAATASTIVSGAVAGTFTVQITPLMVSLERATLPSYLVYNSVLSGWVYPTVVHWVWSTDGWLAAGTAKKPFVPHPLTPLQLGSQTLLAAVLFM